MSTSALYSILREHFPYSPTSGQHKLLQLLCDFVYRKERKSVFLLRGYAGTGKTSIISALIKGLPKVKLKSVLLAPTGRAAKVLSGYSGKPALTIHKKIYQSKILPGGGRKFVLRENLHTNTIFFIDEASMISDSGGLGGSFLSRDKSLLEDVLDYVFSGVNCKLIFIGDTAQLPPVGLDISPALDPKLLNQRFHLSLEWFELTEVVRQSEGSGILTNATDIRNMINEDKVGFPKFVINDFPDVERITGEDLEDAMNHAYSKYGDEEVMIVCRSNKQANQYNQEVRRRIKWQEDEVSAGDYLMVVRNNYYWLPKESPAGFIANGDIAEVLKITGQQELYGFRFAEMELRLIDYPDEPPVEARVILDTIMAETPALPKEDSRKLYESVKEDYKEITDRNKRQQKVKTDPYLNALQVKLAYAVTCHKAQGGQWKAVFVDQGYLTEEMVDKEYLRWLYTAITRATEKLYVVNFHPNFFGERED